MTFEQLGKSAYEAYAKHSHWTDTDGMLDRAAQWSDLDKSTRACWIAVAQQVVAEIATAHQSF